MRIFTIILRQVPFILLVVLSYQSKSQSNYRVEKLNNIEYLLPPGVNLKFAGSKSGNVVKERHKYLYIDLKKLSKDYSVFIQSINEAETWQGDIDYFTITDKEIAKAISTQKANSCTFQPIVKSFFNLACLDVKGSRFFIQIDINKLNTTTSTKTPVDNYDDFALDFLKTWTFLENTNVCGCTNSIAWPGGIGITLLNKLKEWMPLPLEAKLSYASFFLKKDNYSVIFISPEITLRVDDVKKVDESSTKFYHEWHGSNLFKFNKDNEGRYIQNKLGRFLVGLPNNQIDDANKGVYQLSSFADLQNSGALIDFNYICLYTPVLKRNNNIKSDFGTGYSPSDDVKQYRGNSMFLHLTSNQASNIDFPDADFATENYVQSVFGLRESIQALITIYVNGSEKLIDIISNPADVSVLPGSFKIFRKYGTHYKKIKGNKINIPLLTNDHIKYKL